MTLSARRLPRQRVTLQKKLENNKQWAKDIIDYLCYYADEFNDVDGADFRRKQSNYLLYNNVLNQEDFERECNPLGIEVGQFKDSIKEKHVLLAWSWIIRHRRLYDADFKIAAAGQKLFTHKGGMIRRLPPPMRGWTEERDIRPLAKESFVQSWRNQMSGNRCQKSEDTKKRP